MKSFTGVCNLCNVINPNYYFDDISKVFYDDFCIFTNYTNDVYSITVEGYTYSILFLGEIYNLNELKDKSDFDCLTNSAEEFILKSYIYNKLSLLNEFNGPFVFAIWNSKAHEIFIVRDHMGIKPLYYSILNNTLYFSSSLDKLLNFDCIEPVINSESIAELFGLGPAHTPGTCLFKNIHELRPAHYMILNEDGLHIRRFWHLKNKEHTDDLKTTCDKISHILTDSIHLQLPNSTHFCIMLSGGLDSSIITAYASKFCKNNKLSEIKTISVDYVDNDKNFVKSDFQPNSDNYYINLMCKHFNTTHKVITIDTPELAESLKNVVEARSFPGMADIDSSLFLFCKQIKKEYNIAISGECSDEIFAGYPWFFRDDCLDSNTFPWSLAISERQNILSSDFADKINIKDYIDFRYHQSLDEIPVSGSDSVDTAIRKKINYLTYNWFMQTLLDRAERIANYTDLEIRVPFCDYRLVEYLWNIPWEMKAYEGREKGLLRYIVKDSLPDEIVNRKKSPYPKTHNPTYLSCVKKMLINIMKNNNSPILKLINKNFINEIINTDGKSFKRPWFGQLMTGPQLMAYLCQINIWLEKYNPKIEI